MIAVHWAAGILEGEGCYRNTKYTQQVWVTNNDLWVLEKLRHYFGGMINARKKYDNPNWKQSYLWRLSGPRARGFMLTMYSLMSPRRQEQIRKGMALEF